MKRITKLAIVSIALILLIVIISFRTSGSVNNDSPYEYTHFWTKALCNETHCQDYVIYCNGEEFIRQRPITGAVISIPKGWEDPRNESMRDRVCE